MGWKKKDPGLPGTTTGWPGVTGVTAYLWSHWKQKGASSRREQGTAESPLFTSRMLPAPQLHFPEHSRKCRAGEQGQRETRTATAAAGAGL